MKNLKDFIQAFFKNNGQHVFLSLLIAKICAFAGSIIMVRILPESEFGVLSIVASVFAIFVPFTGFGSTQSLMRFGSLCEDENEKKELSAYLFLKGFVNQLILSLIFFFTAFFYVEQYSQIVVIFLFFTVRLIGIYFLTHVQSEKRIHFKNKEFAAINNVINIFGLVMTIPLSYYYGIWGYLFVNALSPFVSLFWFKNKSINFKAPLSHFKTKEIWSFALHASTTALLSEAFFSADILLLSFLKDENMVAHYRVAILLPSNITFLAISFMQSDYSLIAKNFRNKLYLKNYILNYYKIFIPLSVLICLIGYFASEAIISLFFGKQYIGNSFIFSMLLVAFCGSMLLRNLYGNLLAAVGLMKKNTLYSFVSLLVLALLTFLLVPKDGLLGMSIAMSLTLTFTGFLLMFSFMNYYRKLK